MAVLRTVERIVLAGAVAALPILTRHSVINSGDAQDVGVILAAVVAGLHLNDTVAAVTVRRARRKAVKSGQPPAQVAGVTMPPGFDALPPHIQAAVADRLSQVGARLAQALPHDPTLTGGPDAPTPPPT